MRVRKQGPSVLGLDIGHLLVRLAVNTVAILVASKLIDGIRLDDWQGAVLAGAIFGILNTFVKPVVKLLTCPLYLLTMGLFALVVNALMLALTSWIAEQASIGFRVDGILADFTGAIVIGVVAWLVSLAFA